MPLPNTIHLGFAKCGSTFLQAFWRNHPSVEMVFKSAFFAPLDSGLFGKGAAHYASFFPDASCHKCVMESDEHLLMGLFHPRLGVRCLTRESVKETCLRLKSVIPNAKLLMVVRNQLEMMVSTYSQYLLGGGILTLDQFAEEFMHCSITRKNYFCFYFDEIVEMVEECFPGQLKVILAEELARDTEEQLNEICKFLNVPFFEFHSTFRDRRVGLSKSGMQVVRALNRAIVRRHAPRFEPDLWLPKPTYKFVCNIARVVEHCALRPCSSTERHQIASPSLIASMHSHFAESNDRFGAILGKDLSRWSYSLSETIIPNSVSDQLSQSPANSPTFCDSLIVADT